MWKKGMILFSLALSATPVAAAQSPQNDHSVQASGEANIVLSTRDQNVPGVFMGLPPAIADLDRPRGGVEIELLPDNQIILYLRLEVCVQDMFGRDVFCSLPPDFYFEGRIQEVGTVTDGEHTRTLYDMIIEPGTLGTRLVITDQGEYFLIVPLDSQEPRYRRVKLFVRSE